MKFTEKQKRYILILLSLIFFCELLIKINNIVFQVFGVLLVPSIVTYAILILRNDEKM